MFQKYVFTSILSFLIAGTLSAESPIENVFKSAIEKRSSTIEAKASPYLLTKTIDTETISIEFPGKPKTKKKDGVYTAELELNKSDYILLSPEPPESGIDSADFFDYVLDEMATDYTILNSNISSESGYDILACHSIDKKGKLEQKFEVYVTQNNFYIVSTEFFKGKENESHSKFRSSFKFVE